MTNTSQAVWCFDELLGADGKTDRQAKPYTRLCDGVPDEESPWDRIGLSRPQQGSQRSVRVLHGFFFVSAWLAMPLAVLTCHGWVGLLVHGLALSGAAGLLQKATLQARMGLRLQQLDSGEGEGPCEGEGSCGCVGETN